MILQNKKINVITLKFIETKPNNDYVLIDKNNNKYILGLEFHGLNKPSINDKLLIHKSMLDKRSKNYTDPYSFTLATKNFDINNPDCAVLLCNNKEIEMERIYG